MRTRTRVQWLLLTVLVLVTQSGRTLRAESTSGTQGQKRIAFRIAAIEQRDGTRNQLSEVVVEGPAGTDFIVKLNGERFRMNAKFLTDLLDDSLLQVRAAVDTRRLYGLSERRLPLYEEDEQRQAFTLGFDEQMVVLPFGRKEDKEQLRIEITPGPGEHSSMMPSGKLRPLEITILKQSPGGSINVEAVKTPHRFEAEAVLTEDGREIARTNAPLLLEEARDLILKSEGQNDAGHLVRLSVGRYIRGRPVDDVEIGFDVDRLSANGVRESIAKNYAGICELGRPVTYDITDIYRGAPGRKYELRFNIALAAGESPD